MWFRALRATESGTRLGTRSARRVRFPKGREPPQGAATKPFGASIFDNWMKRRIALHETGRAILNLTPKVGKWPSLPLHGQRTVAGAVGGLFAGCTVGGIGPNFFGA